MPYGNSAVTYLFHRESQRKNNMRVYPLQAAHGDALIVESELEGKTFRIVIDGGPEETADAIADIYLRLGHIDLLVLTHYDADHITGLLRYFEKLKGEECVVDRVWANCASIVDYDDEENAAAYENAYELSRHLEKLRKRGVVGEWRDDITMELETTDIGPFHINVLSPTNHIQNELLRRYKEYIEKEGLQDDLDIDEDVSFGRVLKDAAIELSDLATLFRPLSTSFMNQTSIALRIQAEDKTFLMLGDADAKVISTSLKSLGATENEAIKADLVKVSHHGSKANICQEMIKLLDCSKFLFTTNGGDGGAYHPDRQTIACIDAWAKNSNHPITLYFNYPLSTIMQRNVGLLKDEERGRFTIIEGQSPITL